MIKIVQYIYFRSRNRSKLYISQLQDLTSLQVLNFFFFFIRGNKKTLMIVNIRESWSCEIYSFRLFFCTCTPEIYIYIYIYTYIYILYIYIYLYIYTYTHILSSWRGKHLVRTQIFPANFVLVAIHEGYYLFSIWLFV